MNSLVPCFHKHIEIDVSRRVPIGTMSQIDNQKLANTVDSLVPCIHKQPEIVVSKRTPVASVPPHEAIASFCPKAT